MPSPLLGQLDDKLLAIGNAIALPTLASTHNVFHDLMSCVVEQQIHYRSTKKSFQKLLNQAGLASLNVDNFSQFEQQALAKAKLALPKLETIVTVVDFFKNNQVEWSQLDDQEVRQIFSTIKGIGPWTVDMILLFTLGRPQVFPADDFHLKQIMTSVYGLNPQQKLKAQMLAISEKWGGHKSLAVRYLLAWKQFNRNQ
jgi:DNA-3-methyladenine glycosylase II